MYVEHIHPQHPGFSDERGLHPQRQRVIVRDHLFRRSRPQKRRTGTVVPKPGEAVPSRVEALNLLPGNNHARGSRCCGIVPVPVGGVLQDTLAHEFAELHLAVVCASVFVRGHYGGRHRVGLRVSVGFDAGYQGLGPPIKGVSADRVPRAPVPRARTEGCRVRPREIAIRRNAQDELRGGEAGRRPRIECRGCTGAALRGVATGVTEGGVRTGCRRGCRSARRLVQGNAAPVEKSNTHIPTCRSS